MIERFLNRQAAEKNNRKSEPDIRRKNGRGVRRVSTLAAAGAIPLFLALGCSGSTSSSPSPDIATVPSASQLPPPTADNAADYSNADQTVWDASAAGVGNYAEVNKDLGAIKNATIATFATAAAEGAEANSALLEEQDLTSSPDSVAQAIKGLRVVSVRTAARQALDDGLAQQAIVDAGDFTDYDLAGNLNNKSDAEKALSEISDSAVRNEAEKGVELALALKLADATKVFGVFESKYNARILTIEETEAIRNRALDDKLAA